MCVEIQSLFFRLVPRRVACRLDVSNRVSVVGVVLIGLEELLLRSRKKYIRVLLMFPLRARSAVAVILVPALLLLLGCALFVINQVLLDLYFLFQLSVGVGSAPQVRGGFGKGEKIDIITKWILTKKNKADFLLITLYQKIRFIFLVCSIYFLVCSI